MSISRKLAQKFILQLHGIPMSISGSYKRGASEMNDLDFITKENLNKINNELYKRFHNIKTNKKGNLYASYIINFDHHNIKVDIWKYNKENHLFVKLNRDYSKGTNIQFRLRAKELGYILNDKGLYKKTGERIPIKNLDEFFKYLKLPKIKPNWNNKNKK